MTLKHLRIFLEVYNQMSITHAAETLNMTQPAVTRSIHELEDYYGIHLFERINHRLYKTDASEALYSQALHIINSFETMEQEILDWGESGTLRIGSNITIGSFTLPVLINEFQKLYPKLKIKVQIANSEIIQNALLNNEIDVALLEGSVAHKYLHTEQFSDDMMQLILPINHPLTQKNNITIQDIIKYPLLLREKGSASRTVVEMYFSENDIKLEPSWESSSSHALITAVSIGVGISILPHSMVQHDIQKGLVAARSLEDKPFRFKNYIVWHKQKYLNKTIKSFIDQCRHLALPLSI